eukprot:m51a1_g6471 hypothetical protein (386) ;mRNA; f:67823-69294
MTGNKAPPPYWKLSVTVLEARNVPCGLFGLDAYCAVTYETRVPRVPYAQRKTPVAPKCKTGSPSWPPEEFVFDVADRINDTVRVGVWDSRALGDSLVSVAVIPVARIMPDAWHVMLDGKGRVSTHAGEVRVQFKYLPPDLQLIPGTDFAVAMAYDPSEFVPAEWGRVVHAHYSHHFIVTSREGAVVHFDGSASEALHQMTRDGVKRTLRSALNGTVLAGRVQVGSLAQIFHDARKAGARVEKVIVPQGAPCRPDAEVLLLAELIVREDEGAVAEAAQSAGVSPEVVTTYNLWTSNCQHLACWLKTGEWKSPEVNSALRGLMTRLGARVDKAETMLDKLTRAVDKNPSKGVTTAAIKSIASAAVEGTKSSVVGLMQDIAEPFMPRQ